MRRSRRLMALLLAIAQIGAFGGCHHTIDGGGASQSNLIAGILGTNDIGAVVFQLYRSHVAKEPDPAVRQAKLAVLDPRRADFVAAVNAIANSQTLQNSLQSTSSIFTLVDDGTIPKLAEDAAQVLDLLLADAAAQQAVVALAQNGQGPVARVPLDDFIALLGRIDNYPQVEKLWAAAADMVQQNPQLMTDLTGLASRKLLAVQAPAHGTTIATLLSRLDGALLDPARFLPGQGFGTPEWVVRLDDRGVPLVATDPATNTFVSPFVDDGTGHAAIDGQGRFVDAAGAPISIQPFGQPGAAGYDSSGLAVNAAGANDFVYFDAKATVLAVDMKLAGDLLQKNAHEQALDALERALGPQHPDKSYDDGALGDLAYGSLELLGPDEMPRLVRALATLIETDPVRAERLLVSLGEAIDKCKAAHQASAQAGGIGSLSLSDPKVVRLTDDLLPLVDAVSSMPAQGGPSTTRVLFSVFDDLRTRVPDWPARLAPLLVQHRIQPAVPVDFTKPATYVAPSGATIDNRSSIHQLLDLLARAQGCSVPLSNKTLAETIVDIMADQTPQTAGSLATLVSSIPGFIINIACPGISNDIQSLDDLAKSGSLDALLPIAKVFKDHGETKLLVQILVRVQQDYATIGRPFEQDASRVLASGAVEQLSSLAGETTRIVDPVSGLAVSNILADGLAKLVDQHASNAADRRGQRVPSLAYLVLIPLRALDARLGGSGTALADSLAQVFLARAVDPRTGQKVLANESVLPFAAKALRITADSLPADQATRRSDLRAAEGPLASFLSSSDLGTLVTLGRTIMNASSRPLFDAAAIDLLTPSSATDTFGALVKLAAIEMQVFETLPASTLPSISRPAIDLAHFAGNALDPSRPLVQDAIVAVTKILTVDQGRTVLVVVRAACNPPPSGGRPPLAVIVTIVSQVSFSGPASALTTQGLQDALNATLAFMRTPRSGLQAVFDAIKKRRK